MKADCQNQNTRTMFEVTTKNDSKQEGSENMKIKTSQYRAGVSN